MADCDFVAAKLAEICWLFPGRELEVADALMHTPWQDLGYPSKVARDRLVTELRTLGHSCLINEAAQ